MNVHSCPTNVTRKPNVLINRVLTFVAVNQGIMAVVSTVQVS